MPDGRAEVIAKIAALVEARWGGDYSAAFRHYSDDGDERVGLVGVVHLLEDAGVGNWWTRTTYGRAIIRLVDENKDGKISEFELRRVLEEDAA